MNWSADDDDRPVKASTVELLRDIDLPVWTVLRVLADSQFRLADLFGLNIKAGTRYTATVDHPDLAGGVQP